MIITEAYTIFSDDKWGDLDKSTTLWRFLVIPCSHTVKICHKSNTYFVNIKFVVSSCPNTATNQHSNKESILLYINYLLC